jgi:hypothetical protein
MLCPQKTGRFQGIELATFQTDFQKSTSGDIIASVTFEVLNAAVTAHQRTTIQRIFINNAQTTHNQPSFTSLKAFTKLVSQADKLHFTFNENCHIFTVLSQFDLEVIVIPSASSFHAFAQFDTPVDTTKIKNNQNERAAIVYTGTIANAINCFTLNFSAIPDHLSFQKKYMSQNIGEIII